MPNQTNTVLTPYVVRARKVLQLEQRANHQDSVVKPSGLEMFVVHWADETIPVCKTAGLDFSPIYRFTEHLEGYRRQDPMQRAASLRAALAILDELDGPATARHTVPQTTSPSPPSAAPAPGRRQADAPTRYEDELEGPATARVNSSRDPGDSKGEQQGPRPSATAGESSRDPDHRRPQGTQSPRLRPSRPPPPPPPLLGTKLVAGELEGPATARMSSPKADNPIRLEAGMSQGHTALTLLSADVTAVPGVGPTVATRLHSLGIRSVSDLLFYFPREHRDYSKLEKIVNIPFGEVATTMGLIWEVETARTGGGRVRTVATISDDTGKLRVSWWNQSYLQKQLSTAKGSYLVVTGAKQRFGNKVEFSVRSHELPEQGDLLNTGRLVPTYPLTEGLHAKALRRFTKWVVDRYAMMVPEYLPLSIRSAGKLMPLPEAVSQMHYPENEETLTAARRRLAFDELFLIQLGMQERRSRGQSEAPQGNAFRADLAKILIDVDTVAETLDAAGDDEGTPIGTNMSRPPPGRRQADAGAINRAPTSHDSVDPTYSGGDLALVPMGDREGAPLDTDIAPLMGATLWSTLASEEPFEATLPFRFTQAQRRVIGEIFADLAQSKPMSRLLQGDVGSGKTAVAAAALLIAAINGYQSAIMAPTEILAEQHARSISAMLEPFGIRTALLTGGQRQRERAMGRAAIESGQAMVAIGTHALIQDDVKFQRLGLVIVDEQHRFGVEQRDTLRQKGYHSHMLVMTATPIPRTLALTLYGDLDVSVIDELPPGRQKIISRWRSGARREEAYKLIAQEVAVGRQSFIICPLIEESETLAVKAVTVEYERLSSSVFPDLRLGLLHGAMKSGDKDQVMRRFRDHELDILVATSVIEVGIDVPNATVMVIEDADRFGLSQLHQLRGRVGRGQDQSFCYVLSLEASLQAQQRLEIFQATNDGFRLAEEDLRLRGPGDFLGVRQSGIPELRVANLSDVALIELARSLAIRLWEGDPYLRKAEHAALRERMHRFWQNFMAH